MSSDQMKQMMQMVISKTKSSDDLKKSLAKWVGPYHGKVLQIQTGDNLDEFFYIVVTKDKMWLKDGEYPSPDVTYRAKSQVLLDIFTGRAPFGKFMKSWELMVIGAGHESVPLAKLIFDVMTSI